MDREDFEIFRAMQARTDRILQVPSHAPLPDVKAVVRAAKSLHGKLPEQGEGFQETSEHLLQDVVPGLNGSSLSPTYFGFVTGGITPPARFADSLVTLFDQNVQVHLDEETVATIVEEQSLYMLLELLNFDAKQWPIRTLSTGATASNLLGLACGREYVISQKSKAAGHALPQGEGLLSSCLAAGIKRFQVLTTLPHSSLGKAANICGLGSSSIINVSKDNHWLNFDMAKLETLLERPDTASIVVISCGEVNTGAFATNSLSEVRAIRALCDRYDAWLHVDGAFGLLARALPVTSQYAAVRAGSEGLELADSIASDGHKLLNVPYDCGVFLCRHRDLAVRVFQNTNAVYLGDSPTEGTISPLNIRVENSARFRGLPLYASLCAYGRDGYAAMLARMVDLARKIARFIDQGCPHLELLPQDVHNGSMESVYICVLFRARDYDMNKYLVENIKASGKVYASGTRWDGEPAARFAIAKWNLDVDRDFEIVKGVLLNLSA